MAQAYEFKEQTKKHKKAMKAVCDKMIDSGFVPEEIIDAGDYLLNEQSLKLSKGQEDVKANKSGKAKATKGASDSSKDKPSDKGKASKGKSTGKTKAKGKSKKQKAK